MQTVCFHLYHISLLAIYFIFCMDIFFILSFLLHCSFSRSRCTIDLNKKNKTSTSRISIRITCFYFQKVTLGNRYSEKRYQSSKYGNSKLQTKEKQTKYVSENLDLCNKEEFVRKKKPVDCYFRICQFR